MKNKFKLNDIYFIDDKLYHVVGFAENGDPLLANEETIFEILS